MISVMLTKVDKDLKVTIKHNLKEMEYIFKGKEMKEFVELLTFGDDVFEELRTNRIIISNNDARTIMEEYPELII